MYRSKNQLPEGYDWIDQRDQPEYPIVYGPMDYVCSYNPKIEKCLSYQPETPQAEEKAPNIVMIAIESFSPSPMMLNKNVTNN